MKKDPNKPVSYYHDVRPIFQTSCFGCHQPAKPLGGLVMTNFDAMKTGGDSGDAALVAGEPDESLLLEMIKSQDGVSWSNVLRADQHVSAADIFTPRTTGEQSRVGVSPERE